MEHMMQPGILQDEGISVPAHIHMVAHLASSRFLQLPPHMLLHVFLSPPEICTAVSFKTKKYSPSFRAWLATGLFPP